MVGNEAIVDVVKNEHLCRCNLGLGRTIQKDEIDLVAGGEFGDTVNGLAVMKRE